MLIFFQNIDFYIPYMKAYELNFERKLTEIFFLKSVSYKKNWEINEKPDEN